MRCFSICFQYTRGVTSPLTVDGLVNDGIYRVAVRAENRYGVSKASVLSAFGR
jgi:hypothetical protein